MSLKDLVVTGKAARKLERDFRHHVAAQDAQRRFHGPIPPPAPFLLGDTVIPSAEGLRVGIQGLGDPVGQVVGGTKKGLLRILQRGRKTIRVAHPIYWARIPRAMGRHIR